jgi:hypothetical protein
MSLIDLPSTTKVFLYNFVRFPHSPDFHLILNLFNMTEY